MIETIKSLFIENEAPKDRISLRFHHLMVLSQIADAYNGEFSDTPPWGLSEEQKNKALNFIDMLVRKNYQDGLDEMNKVEDSAFGRVVYEEEIARRYDVLGKTKAENQAVINLQINFFKSLFLLSADKSDEELILTQSKDGICNACAVGSHCKRNIPFRLSPAISDADKAVRNSLTRLSKSRYKGLVKTGEFPLMSISNALLFDENFYDALKKDLSSHIPFIDF